MQLRCTKTLYSVSPYPIGAVLSNKDPYTFVCLYVHTWNYAYIKPDEIYDVLFNQHVMSCRWLWASKLSHQLNSKYYIISHQSHSNTEPTKSFVRGHEKTVEYCLQNLKDNISAARSNKRAKCKHTSGSLFTSAVAAICTAAPPNKQTKALSSSQEAGHTESK